MKDTSKIFLETTEKYVTSLGNNYLQNYITDGVLNKGFAVVSEKRVYFKGACYTRENKKVYKTSEEHIVDLKDVTGTGYVNINPLWMCIVAIACFGWAVFCVLSALSVGGSFDSDIVNQILGFTMLLGIGLSILFFIGYQIEKMYLFEISYSGGRICFNVKWYSKSEIDNFQRLLRIAKDNVTIIEQTKEQSTLKINTLSHSLSTADELKKYAELLKEGILTQEEFETLKAKQLQG